MGLKTVVAAVSMFLIGLGGCAKEVRLPFSTELPAAMGEARISRDDNGNTVVNLKVEHFAPPQRLQPPRQVYVVWLESPDHEMHNLGQLRVNDDLKGELESKTPYEVFRIIITAEDYATAAQPGPQVVMRTKVINATE